MKNILFMTTGGTLASKHTNEGLVPSINSDCILSFINTMSIKYNITTKDILNLDSSNIQPEEWVFIAENIYENYYKYDGIVITHGTDTMAYTASMLSFMLRNITIPIVITGSQLPIEHPLTDAIENLCSAFAMAASETHGVFVAFNRKIILGTRAVKTHTIDFAAFESINSPYAAWIDGSGININKKVIPHNSGKPRLETNICSDVFLIKLTPGLEPQILDVLVNLKYKGIVIEAFGVGGLHFYRRNLISKLQDIADIGINIVVCSQCLYERSDFSIYQSGQKALKKGIIQAYDMTTEAVVTKLMWTLGKTNDSNEIQDIFRTNFVGEINILS